MAPTAFLAGPTALTDYDRRWRMTDAWPSQTPTKDPRRYCGGRYATGSELLALDTAIGFTGRLYPDQQGWILSRLAGGSTGYVVTGSGDPYLHTSKKLVPSRNWPDYFSALLWYEGQSSYFEFYGLQFNQFQITIPPDPTEAITYTAGVLGSGKKVKFTSGVTEPGCVEENEYRAGNVTYTLTKMSDSSSVTIDPVRCEWTVDCGLDPKPRLRSGLYISSPREFGAEHPNVAVTLVVVDEPGSAIEDFRDSNPSEEFLLTVALANASANRVETWLFRDLDLQNVEAGYELFNEKHVHILQFIGVVDKTSPTTIANSPWYTTVQTGTATYRRT